MIPRLRRNEEERARFPDEADETVVLRQYDDGADHDEEAEPSDDEQDLTQEPTLRVPRHRG